MISRILLFLVLATFLGSISAATAVEPTASEAAKIEALIAKIENLTDATFLRNGNEYDSKTAAKFLRGKWHARDQDIKTADDFITKVATKSSTTGNPYQIRLKGKSEISCADYLTSQLKELK